MEAKLYANIKHFSVSRCKLLISNALLPQMWKEKLKSCKLFWDNTVFIEEHHLIKIKAVRFQ